MTEPPAMTNEPDFAEIVNRGHDAYLKKLEEHAASDSFPYWLRCAALSFCVNFKDVGLKGKLKYGGALVRAVNKGFKQVKDLQNNFPEDERDRMEYCQALFTQTCEDLPDAYKTVQSETQKYNLRSSVKSESDALEAEDFNGQRNLQSSSGQLSNAGRPRISINVHIKLCMLENICSMLL